MSRTVSTKVFTRMSSIVPLLVALLLAATGGMPALAMDVGLEVRYGVEDRSNQIDGSLAQWSLSIPLQSGAISGSVGVYGSDPKLNRRQVVPLYEFALQAGAFSFSAGRHKLPNWGYGVFEPLVLSDKALPMSQASYRINVDKGSYQRILGVIDKNAYLVAHRLAVDLMPSTEVYVAEVSVVSPDVANNPMLYIPLWPTYQSQDAGLYPNDSINANMAVGIRRETASGAIHADLFVDDMPQPGASNNIYRLAGQIGGTWRLDDGKVLLKAEYTRVNNYTYTFRGQPYDYAANGVLLGHSLGPDSDLLQLEAEWAWNDRLRLAGGMEIRRHGAGKLGDIWEHVGLDYAKEHSFLTGVVEKQALAVVRLSSAGDAGWSLVLKAGPRFNTGHAAGETSWETEVAGGYQVQLH